MIISPSVLSLDYSKFNQQIEQLNESNAEWIHFDVMDGHFVPNLTFGPDILKGYKKASTKILDVHIMVTNPIMFSEIFINAGADIITFHYETLNHEQIIELIKYIKSKKVMVGISIKPNTAVEVLKPYLKDIDVALVMSVEPGFGGQSFIESSINKIKYLKNQKSINNYNYFIEVDGGINDLTASLAQEAGAEVLVSGSYIFKGDIKKNIDILLNKKV